MRVTFEFDCVQVPVELNRSSTSQVLYGALPFKSKVNLWGDEIYFEVPVKLGPENATLDVQVGDVGYWPRGSCVCLFFGRTPASTDDRPRPASEVNVIGTFSLSADALRKVREGSDVIVTKR